MKIKKEWISWEEFEKIQGGTWRPAAHTHPRSEITDFWSEAFWANITDKPSTFPPSAHTLASHSTKAHSELTGVTSDLHHAQIHAASHLSGGGDSIKLDDLATPDDNTDLNASTTRHGLLRKLTGSTSLFLRADGAWAVPAAGAHAGQHEIGGGDLVDHDNLTNYSPAEHVSHPGTIAAVLSDHNVAAHNALDITELGTVSSGVWQGTAIANAYIAGINQDLLITSDVYFNTVRSVKTAHAAGSSTFHMEVYSPDTGDGSKEVSIKFRQLGQYQFQIRANAVGFRFTADRLDDLHASAFLLSGTKLDDLATPDDNTDLNASTTRHGLLLKLTGSTSLYLRADGTWAAPMPGVHAGQHEVGGGDLISHDDLTDFLAVEHANHSAIQMIAGSGLSGGGYINANRTFNLGALTTAWDAGGYQIRALKFYADQATGTAPFTVLSTTKVANLNADYLDGYHLSTTRNSANTVPVRDGSGYLQLGWINTTSGDSGTNTPIRIYGSHSGNYIRYYTPTNFATVMKPYLDDHFALITRKLDDFGTPDDNTDLDASTSRHGLLKKLGGGTTNFLRADGAWAAPAGGGGLTTYFSAYRSTAQAFGTGVDTRVLFNVENYDIGGNYAGSIFTAPANGYYYLHAAVGLNSLLSATAVYVRFRKSGPTTLAQTRWTGPSGIQTIHVTATLYLTSGTWVEVTVYHNRGSNMNVQFGSTWTYFEGHRLDA